MSSLLTDLRFAARQLRRNPGFTLVAVLTLGVGIGATIVMFSVFNGTVLRKLPFPDSDLLVRIVETSPQGHVFSLSEPNFLDYRERTRSFSQVVAVTYRPMTVAGDQGPLRVTGVATSEGLFEALGVSPAFGRVFSTSDYVAGGDVGAVIIGHGLWESHFGGDPSVLGRSIDLDGIPRVVIGVMPQGFGFPRKVDAWIPFVPDPSSNRAEHLLESFGRLNQAVSVAQALIELDEIASQLGNEYPQSNREWGASLITFRDWLIGERATQFAIVLLGSVGLLLLLACASVSNLMLARTTIRQREMALRATLGAVPPRIVRQLFVESLVLAVLSACAGLLFTAWVLPVIQALETDTLPRLGEVSIDKTVVIFTIVVTAVTGLACGMAPAFQATDRNFDQALRGGERIVTGGARRVGDTLVVFQLALAVILLVGAGLLTNSFLRLLDADRGFDAESILVVEISLPEDRYPLMSALVSSFYRETLSRIEAIPGVEATGASMVSPLSINRPSGFVAPKETASQLSDFFPIQWRSVTPGFFEAIGSRLLTGRFFDEHELKSDASPFLSEVENPHFNAVIGESLAKHFWPADGAIGRQLVWDSPNGPVVTVVGVVADFRDGPITSEHRPTVFLPHSTAPASTMTILVNVKGDPEIVAPAVRRAIWAGDERVSVPNMQSFDDALQVATLSGPRLNATLVGLFASAALGLAALGIYGLTAFSVVRRRREFGVRMALGAAPVKIVGLALGRGTRLIGFGSVLGFVGAVGLSQFLAAMLYEIEPTDPITYLIVILTLITVAMAANYIPARRATRVDPRVAFSVD